MPALPGSASSRNVLLFRRAFPAIRTLPLCPLLYRGAMSPTPMKHKVGNAVTLVAQKGGYPLAHSGVYELRNIELVRDPCFSPGLQLPKGKTLLPSMAQSL